MRTKSFLKHLFLGALLLTTGKVVGQSTTPGNVALGVNDFLGWDNTFPANNFPLMVRHDLNQPIDFYTSALGRARLMPTGTATINTFNNINQDGFFLLSGTQDYLTNGANRAPFTRLHLVDAQVSGTNQTVYAQEFGYRNWQRNGITFTGNRDHGYVGQRYWGNDQTDFVVQWADNAAASPWGTDRMKIVFTSAFNAAATRGATTANGLEAMRLFPVDLLQVNVGIGDFSQPGLAQQDPTERLHMLDGRLRIEQLPGDAEHTGTYEVMVVDNSAAPSGERGVVKWVDPNNLPSATDCDWVVQSPDPHISSAYTGSSCTWNMKHGVGIGYQFPKTKLDVFHTDNTFLDPIAIRGDARFDYEDGQTIAGVIGQASSTQTSTIQNMQVRGVEGLAYNGRESIGVNGIASCAEATDGSATRVVGVSGEATANENADICIGVYGKAAGATGGSDWAAVFEGLGFIAAPWWIYSDQGLKDDIADLNGATATEQLLALQPKTYTFNSELGNSLGLPEGPQRGFLSQEVEEVLPDLVKEVHRPAVSDSLGNEVEPAMTFKAMNYEGLIPLLVATVQEQQARLSVMDQRLSSCCASGLRTSDENSAGESALDKALDPAKDRLLRIAPNPFNERTTVFYTVPKAGRAQLPVNNSNGKDLRVLHEGTMDPGDFQFEWDTTELAAGTYYVTLLLNGETVVQKAVKVVR